MGSYYEQTGSTITKYYYAGTQQVAMRVNGTLSFLLTDHLSSTSITTNASGGLISELRYTAWGEVRFTEGLIPTKYTFTSQYSNITDFGLMFYNARWPQSVPETQWRGYDPALGRFAQADSLVPPGAQGYDRYAYVNNDPVGYTDPTGNRPCNGELCQEDAGGRSGGGKGSWYKSENHKWQDTIKGMRPSFISVDCWGEHPCISNESEPASRIMLHPLESNVVSRIPIYDYSHRPYPRIIGYRVTSYAYGKIHVDFIKAIAEILLPIPNISNPASITNVDILYKAGEHLIRPSFENLAGLGIVITCPTCDAIGFGLNVLSSIDTINKNITIDAYLRTYDSYLPPPPLVDAPFYNFLR